MRKRKGHDVECYISYLICPTCGKRFPIPRRPHHSRERGHIKTVWCPYCKRKTDMREIRYGDFYKTMSGEIIER